MAVGKGDGNWSHCFNCADCAPQVIPTPLHVLGRISPIFTPFFSVFCAFSPSRRHGSNEPQAGTQDQETVARAPKHRFAGLTNSGCWERMAAGRAGGAAPAAERGWRVGGANRAPKFSRECCALHVSELRQRRLLRALVVVRTRPSRGLGRGGPTRRSPRRWTGGSKPPRYRWHLGCILPDVPAISLPTGPSQRWRTSTRSMRSSARRLWRRSWRGWTPTSRRRERRPSRSTGR